MAKLNALNRLASCPCGWVGKVGEVRAWGSGPSGDLRCPKCDGREWNYIEAPSTETIQ